MRILFSFRFLLIALVVALGFLACSTPSFAQVGVVVSVGYAPPELPVYEQPLCPGDGYIWTPGYWAWDGDDYYWVPGTWILAPEVGFLWTPPWWGWGGAAFMFHEGYWVPESVSMAASATASVTSGMGMKAAVGTTDTFSTTGR